MGLQRLEIGWEEYGHLARELALLVARHEPDVVVGIARGGAIAGCTLSFLLGKDFYPIRLQKQGGATRVIVGPTRDLAGLHVALVDDLSQSGETFKIASLEIARVGARAITTAALIRREPGYRPDLWAREVTSKVRFPWAREQLVDGVLVKR